MLLNDKCMCLQASENCKSLILQDKRNIEIFLSPVRYTFISMNYTQSCLTIYIYDDNTIKPYAYHFECHMV